MFDNPFADPPTDPKSGNAAQSAPKRTASKEKQTDGAYLAPKSITGAPLADYEANERLEAMLAAANAPQAQTATPPPTAAAPDESERARAMEREDTQQNPWAEEQHAEAETLRLKKHRENSTALSACDFLNQPDEPDDPIIVGLIEQGEMFALVGQSKAGKSLLALQLAVCVSTGRDFLGHKTVRKRVYIANLEVSRKQYKKRLRSICQTLGVNPDDLDGWLFIDNLKGSDVSWEWVLDEAKIRQAELALIDPFYQIFKGAETNELDCSDAVSEMKKFQLNGITLGVIFHSPKGFSGDRQLIDMISGSSVLARFPESIVGLLNHATEERARVIECELRNYPKPDAQSLRFANGEFILAPDLAPVVKSANGKPIKFKSPEERKTEKAAAYDKEQADLRTALTTILDEAGDNLLSVTQVKEMLANAHFAKHTIEDFLKARKDEGAIMTQDALFTEGDKYGKPINRKQGGKMFLSTPDRIKKYLNSFNRLPL